MGHILSCSNILIHTEIPTAYDVKHEQEIRDKAIEEFAEKCKGNVLCQTFGLHPRNIDEIAEQMKEVTQ